MNSENVTQLNKKNSAIVIQNLLKRFDDVTAVDQVSLQIEEGELFGLLGPNGAGKTTIINILCGLIKPTTGSCIVGGYDVQENTMKVKDLIGVCPQETAVYSYLKGFENADLFGNLYSMEKQTLETRRTLLFETMGLTADAKRRADKYSGGMKRRLSLIISLIHDPHIAFLDEPTVAMDPQSRHAVWDFIKDLKKKGKTIILTTHYMEEAEELCDRVGIIDHGRLIALGSPKDLISRNKARDLEDVFIKLTGRKIREEI